MSSLPAVLVVDDEPGVCRMMSRVLNEAGYRVYSANCGEEALVIACQLGERLGLVVTDIRMPTMDGVELASYLGRLEPPPRLLFVSAQGSAAGSPPPQTLQGRPSPEARGEDAGTGPRAESSGRRIAGRV
jgi:CheY-like chemotaxis protein